MPLRIKFFSDIKKSTPCEREKSDKSMPVSTFVDHESHEYHECFAIMATYRVNDTDVSQGESKKTTTYRTNYTNDSCSLCISTVLFVRRVCLGRHGFGSVSRINSRTLALRRVRIGEAMLRLCSNRSGLLSPLRYRKHSLDASFMCSFRISTVFQRYFDGISTLL